MSTAKAHSIFAQEYGHSRNFMTPNLIRRGMAGPELAWELSEGEGIDREPLYGVTVVSVLPGGQTERATDISRCFRDLEEAEAFIEGLKP